MTELVPPGDSGPATPPADVIKKPFSWHLVDPYLEAFIGAV